MLRLVRISACTVGLLVLLPAVARADSYLVTSCHDPLGRANAAAGWVPSSAGNGLTANRCGVANGGLVAALVTAQPVGGSDARWRFSAPAGTRIVRVLARRTTTNFGPSGLGKDVAYVMATNQQPLETCDPSATTSCVADLTGGVDKQGLNATHVEFRVLCTNGASPCSRPVSVQATHAWVALEDQSPPAVSKFRVVDDGETSGKLRVRFDASDVGGGLYRTLTKVDGEILKASPLAAAPCADVAPGDNNHYQFDVPVPCPGAVKDKLATVDVKDLPPGPHGVEIAVEDAAGNQKAVYGPVEFPRFNGPSGSSVTDDVKSVLNARLRMWFVKAPKHGRRYTSQYGTRVVTRGTLRTRTGKGIQGARIDVYHIRRDGKRRLLKTGLKSRRFGRLTLILPNNVDTRTILFAYRALRPGPITSRARLRLTVIRDGKIFYRKGKSKR
ncbi:MAG: hypothetical protein ACRDLS_11140 [Solirubrobacteraceae bacterium]